MQRMTVEERRARLVRRHRLGLRQQAADALEVTNSLVALHSTEAATVFLSIAARTRGVKQTDIEQALYVERTLLRMLGMRRTLFVVPRELAPVVDAACTRAIAKRERRRIEQMVEVSGVSSRPDVWVRRALATALRAIEERGEAFTADLTKSVRMLATPLRAGSGRWEITQSAASRIVPQLAMEGKVIRGRPRTTWANGQYRWVPTAAWLDSVPERLSTPPAQALLLERWLAAFGPATETDVRWWTGWSAREARAALAAVPHRTVDLDGATGYVLADDRDEVSAPEPAAAFLPTLDPTTMGWKQREWYLGPHERVLFDANGNAGPTVWWGGRVVGGWTQRQDGEIVFELLEDVGADAVRAIESEAERIAAWIGAARISSGFLPPFQRGLADAR